METDHHAPYDNIFNLRYQPWKHRNNLVNSTSHINVDTSHQIKLGELFRNGFVIIVLGYLIGALCFIFEISFYSANNHNKLFVYNNKFNRNIIHQGNIVTFKQNSCRIMRKSYHDRNTLLKLRYNLTV